MARTAAWRREAGERNVLELRHLPTLAISQRVQSNADLANLTEKLLRMEFSVDNVTKFLGDNWMRIFDTV